MKLTKRGMIRAISIGSCALAVLIVRNFMLMSENRTKDNLIKSSYVHALEELSEAADNINSTLEKQLYAGTAAQQSELSSKLYTQASAAKAAMAQLPLQRLNLDNTYKLLSQIGNYAQSLAEKTSDGEELTDDEYENLKTLYSYSENLSDQMWSIEQSVSAGEIDIYSVSDSDIDEDSELSFTDGFSELEKGYENYPTLIYDGPFSDHIMEKEPSMTKDAEQISESKALERASMILNISSNDLCSVTEREGNLPCYIFTDENEEISCAVTMQGGYVSYFLKSRQPTVTNLTLTEAVEKAEDFIYQSGYGNMKVTYYEQMQSTVVVNFAYTIDEITCYTDLIKVTVALDDGEILGFEADGYLVNHQKRAFPDETLSVLECEKQLSPYLTCESKSKALIPTDGENEVYCYEFKCKAENGREVLVYINAQTGKEEQILILIESESGTLAI
ncbi:MAG: germination protein YpeB [Ruminococcus sp.]|nr:germination protein YpeB [Ruminococcus sp.]